MFAMLAMAALPIAAAAEFPWTVPPSTGPAEWAVAGPIDSRQEGKRAGIDRDLTGLASGEANAVFKVGDTVAGKAVRRIVPGELGVVDLLGAFGPTATNCVAYAYGVWTSPKAQKLTVLFGSDDGAKVWVNGTLVHEAREDRGLVADQDRFSFDAKEGENRIVVKVDQGDGGFGFAFRAYPPEAIERLELLRRRRDLESMDIGTSEGGFIFRGSAFPTIRFRDQELARPFFRQMEPKVRWFDAELNEVTKPDKPGMYQAWCQWETLDGMPFTRLLPVYRIGTGSLPELPFVPYMEPRGLSVTDDAVQIGPLSPARRAELARHFGRAFIEYVGRSENAPLLMARTLELEPEGAAREPNWLSSGFVRNAQNQLNLRMKVEGRTARPLAPPERLPRPARALKRGSEADAGLKDGTVAKLRALCREWAKDDPNGFVVLVARRGVEAMREGFNGFGPESTFYPASIGKAIAGITFARAVDQGLVDFDTKLSTVFPAYGQGDAAQLTFRHGFVHLTGFGGHASHGGLYNPFLDEAFLAQDLPFDKPGIVHRYNGDGYNLAGKGLEMITGTTFFRMQYESLQKPLGEIGRQFDLGFGDQFSARFLAKVGMMLAQDGVYGDYRFYRPGMVDRLVPSRIAQHIPSFSDKQLEWGIGVTWMPDTPEGGPPPLGAKTFGHGAASASVWRVSREHDLVVVIGRNAFKDWGGTERWAARFMRILADGVKD